MSEHANPPDELCWNCGDPAKGFATVTTAGVERRYCHDGPSPTCYEEAADLAPVGAWLAIGFPLERRGPGL